MQVLLDSGSTVSMIKRSALPQNVVTKTISETKNITTLTGRVQVEEVVILRDLRLPEFDKNRCISQQKALVFDNGKLKYDIILGTNFLLKAGIRLNYSEGKSLIDLGQLLRQLTSCIHIVLPYLYPAKDNHTL